MQILNNKFKKTALYFFISLIVAIALPIVLKNDWACVLGIAAMALFGYQAYTYYKAAKDNDFVTVIAKCVNVSYNDLGAATYAKKCTFEPIENQVTSDSFELQIVNEGKKSKEANMVAGGLYELVFDSSALNDDNALGFNNGTLIAFERCSETNQSKEDKEKKDID